MTDPKPANAFPTKEFFVNMLTRDISLEDTILDLLDNCLDGVLRTLGPLRDTTTEKPYLGFRAKITLDRNWFSIEDNCGGMSLDTLEKEAFRLGRPSSVIEKDLGTVGVYGIGMKRALFKIGKESHVSTRHKDEGEYQVEVPADWVEDTEHWTFKITRVEKPQLKQPGTLIMITPLNDDVAEDFGNDAFINRLQDTIRQTYAIVMRKGFEIVFGETPLEPAELELFVPSNGQGITPYALQGTIDGVAISLACGFYRKLAKEVELDEEQQTRRSPNHAGWTIICNDRVVVYEDRSMLSGWGLSGVPNFHNQFIAFAGVVEFQASNASLLPLTTTKRGIDAGSPAFLKTREYMMKGTKLFTNFTNKWKGEEEQTDALFDQSEKVLATDAHKVVSDQMRDIPNLKGALRLLTPALPLPSKTAATRRITFSKPLADIEKLSALLLGSVEKPAVVGEACFDYTYKALV